MNNDSAESGGDTRQVEETAIMNDPHDALDWFDQTLEQFREEGGSFPETMTISVEWEQ